MEVNEYWLTPKFGSGTNWFISFTASGFKSAEGMWPVGKRTLYGVPAANVAPFSPTIATGESAVEVAISGKYPSRSACVKTVVVSEVWLVSGRRFLVPW